MTGVAYNPLTKTFRLDRAHGGQLHRRVPQARACRLTPPARPLPVSAVLFDLDGTLADSAGDLALALNRVRADAGLPPVPVARLRAHASSGARGLLQAGMGITPGHADYDALRESFLAHYTACLAETTRLFDGVDALLDGIEARGLPWGIVTNKHTRFTQPVVDGAGARAARRRGRVGRHDAARQAASGAAAARGAGAARRARCVRVRRRRPARRRGGPRGRHADDRRRATATWAPAGDPADWPATGTIMRPLDLLDWLP